MTLRRHQKAILAATAASTLLLTAACGSDSSGGDGDPSISVTDSAGDDSGEYAAGTYSAEGSYTNPGGQSSVEVEMTLGDGGVVEDVTVTPQATGTSRQYQDKFVSGIADEVVGKSIDELDVSKVSGSSLTSGGFNEALAQIKSDAQP